MSRVLRTPQADADLAEIWSYIASDNREAGNELIWKLDEMMRRLAESPGLGISQFHIRENLRCKLVAKRYLIFYEPIDQGIRVIRVLHGSRDWERWI